MTTLRDMMGASSTALAANWTAREMTTLIPRTRMWSYINPGKTYQNADVGVRIADGCFTDNTGITALLQRRRRVIIAFLNSNKDIDTEPCSPGDLYALFGVFKANTRYCTGADKRDSNQWAQNTAQVFKTTDFPDFFAQLKATKAAGGPTFARALLAVQPNAQMGVQGGYIADVMVVLLQRSTTWESQLIPSVRSVLKTTYANFPYFSTLGVNGNVIQLTRAQANLMSSYTHWCLLQPTLLGTIRQMLYPAMYY